MFRILAASAALAFGTANAAVITTNADADPNTPDLVVGTATLEIQGTGFKSGDTVDYSETFLAGPIAGGANINVGIINDTGFPAGFDDFEIVVSSAAGSFTFEVTSDEDEAAGTVIDKVFFVPLTPGEEFTVEITSTAYSVNASTAFFTVNFSAAARTDVDEVPLPAGALLMLSGLGAYAASRRARRTAV
ncbi:MAG: VPLPA-CTERM sorting domain-containing protein [Parvularcula sp.]|jgi:hypothetical protein|nr:VPLPA-CTERM sorting domain-containing protein [Parvularcula sp.]